jgi:phenylpropionate dioxygenase-like ring-hydroxylating dioxygenase large terminal subunit
VVRGHDGKVRAFYNVCQHRGHILLKDRGILTTGITCPYHAWSYGSTACLGTPYRPASS